jgi:hypothetical protein
MHPSERDSRGPITAVDDDCLSGEIIAAGAALKIIMAPFSQPLEWMERGFHVVSRMRKSVNLRLMFVKAQPPGGTPLQRNR